VRKPPSKARFLKSKTWIAIPGASEYSLIFGADEQFHASLPDLADVSMVSMTRAVERFGEAIEDMYLRIYFYEQGPNFDPEISPRAPFTLEIRGNGRMSVGAQLSVAGRDYDPYPLLHQIAAPLLKRYRAAPTRSAHYDEHGKVRVYLEFEYASLRGIRIGDAFRLAGKVSALCSAVTKRGQFDSAVVEALIESGRPETLLGQREHDSFDAKSGAYDLTLPAERYELAKDVAAFANGDAAGLIVCGLRTRRVRGLDTVSEIVPVRLEGIRPRDWIGLLRRMVVPSPEGLRVEIKRLAGDSGQGFVLVSIPEQPPHLRPFLLAVGRRDDGKIVETEITVPIRIGAHTEYADVASIHTMLAAGRAALGVRT